MLVLSSLFGLTIMLAGCAGCNHKKSDCKNNNRPKQNDTIIVYQAYEEINFNSAHAEMYTRNGKGGEAKMGYVKFQDVEDGVKMSVSLVDLRPGVTYDVVLYQCKPCKEGKCCVKMNKSIKMPKLRIETVGKLQKSFVIHGLDASDLNHAKIYLERDGGYKASWGTLMQDTLM